MVVPIIVCGREKRWSTPAAWASEAKGESFLLSASPFAVALLANDADADELAALAALAAAAEDRLFEFSSETTISTSSSSSSSLALVTKEEEAAEEAWGRWTRRWRRCIDGDRRATTPTQTRGEAAAAALLLLASAALPADRGSMEEEEALILSCTR